ncbi:tyrosine-protein phosphatase corkscrew-like isoform X2 [Cydia fagiglandana]|uniref:tyrosine-protein phosphatase corkscrew-like isoform X2 n=1 Tax=Cydia fagiglandana TaxID=1458189 RepID=UPI002FEE0CC0
MSKDPPRLSRLGVLAPAALAACMDASVLAVPAAGAIVSTVLKELSKAFMLKKWFHGVMSAKEAEQLIMEKGKNGSYLVRESQTHPGEFVLSVRARGRVSHVMIRRQHKKYDVGSGEQFSELAGLIEHLRAFPMVTGAGEELRLLQPVSGTRLRAHRIQRKLSQMQDIEDSQKLDKKNGFDGEFQSIKMLEDRHVFTTVEGNKPENISKNRYRNILPYDQTRVLLRRSGEHTTDYINASYVRAGAGLFASLHSSTESLDSLQSIIAAEDLAKTTLVSKSLSDDDALTVVRRNMNMDKINGNLYPDAVQEKLYIVTQGCLPTTKDDFWRMVWQEDVRVIAMITNEIERGKTWPDHGTPEEPDGVLAFIAEVNRRVAQVMNEANAPEQNVLCVHCSAGVGRSGTMVVLDILIDKMNTSGLNCTIDVYNTVRLVRAQRGGMVQNSLQYRFIYLALQAYMDTNKIKLKRKAGIFF